MSMRAERGYTIADREQALDFMADYPAYGEQRVTLVARRDPVHPQPRRPRSPEVDEQQADVRIDAHVAEGQVHPVAVEARERERALVEHPHEPGVAALVRALGPARGIRRGQEEHVQALDERTFVLADRRPDRGAADPVDEPARVEAILEMQRSVVIRARLGHGRASSPASSPARVITAVLLRSGPGR